MASFQLSDVVGIIDMDRFIIRKTLQHAVVSIYPTTQFTRLNQTSGFSATSNCTSFEVPSPHNKHSITVQPTQKNSETNNGTFSANAPLSTILESEIDKNPKFEIKLSHLNIRSLKNRDHITQLRLLVQQIKHEIITISETWLNSTVSNADNELEGYKMLRLDRLGKAGGGVCMYYRNDLKVSHLKKLSSISSLGFHQLWVKIQHRKLRSIIVCVAYRPPNCPVTCFRDNLASNYLQALTHGKDIFVLGDLNCNMLKDIPESRAVREFCTSLNLSLITYYFTNKGD